MANQEQLNILKQGVKVWNEWRRGHREIHIDLRGADLDGVDLSAERVISSTSSVHFFGADLSGADLRQANLKESNLSHIYLNNANLEQANLLRTDLSGAKLYDAILNQAQIIEANLSGAVMIGTRLAEANLKESNLIRVDLAIADLYGADLTGADLDGSILEGTNLNGATLSGANLGECRLCETLFGNVDLSMVKGLETIDHQGPSTIGLDTIIKSQGKIPEIFLRKAGVPNSIIEAIPSLIGSLKPIDFYSCFISYSDRDRAFAERLYNDLQGKGVRCWFAPEHLKIGDKFRHRIDESIRVYDKLLLVLSEASLASTWVGYEVEKALDKEPEGKANVLFPIRLDKEILTCETDWAKDIRKSRHIGDFEHWKDHDAYQVAFERLLRDLKAQS